MMNHVGSHVAISLFRLALPAGCSSASNELDRDERMGLPPGYADAGAVELEHELTIGEETGTIFGRIGDVAVDSAGRIFVTDQENIHVRVFRPSGDSLATFGRKGEGPGECDRPSTVLLKNGRIYVSDGYDGQISVFGGEPPFDHRRTFMPARGKTTPARLRTVNSDGFRVMYSQFYRSDVDGYVTSPDDWVAQLNRNGEMTRDSIIVLEGREFLLDIQDRSRLFMSYPFARETVLAFGPDGSMFAGRTDSLRFTRYMSDGQPINTIRFQYEHIPVTQETIDSLASRREGGPRRSLENAELPDIRPAFRDLVVDDQKRVWLDVTNNPDKKETLCFIMDVEEQQVWRTQLDRDVTIHEIREGRIYGVRQDRYGVQEVVVYRVSGLART